MLFAGAVAGVEEMVEGGDFNGSSRVIVSPHPSLLLSDSLCATGEAAGAVTIVAAVAAAGAAGLDVHPATLTRLDTLSAKTKHT